MTLELAHDLENNIQNTSVGITRCRPTRSIVTFHMGIHWIFTLQNKRCKYNMVANAVGLPQTGLIQCLGEFL